MRTVEAISCANKEGKLGLILYTIPNFPTPTEYRKLSRKLMTLPSVSAIETTLPVSRGFSSHANGLIVEGHRLASSYPFDWQQYVSGISGPKPHLCVLYQDSAEEIGFEKFVKAVAPKIDGVILEWSEPNEDSYAKKSERHGVELIKCIGPWMTEVEVEKLLRQTCKAPLIYLMSAPMTGGKLYENKVLRKTAKAIKKIRPLAKIAAGFGIKGKKEIRAIAQIPEIDAVIVGTAFLKKAGGGASQALNYVGGLEEVLCRVN